MFYFEHIMSRPGSLEKATMLGKAEDMEKRRPNMRQTDSRKDAMSLQEPSWATEDRALDATHTWGHQEMSHSAACPTYARLFPAVYPSPSLPLQLSNAPRPPEYLPPFFCVLSDLTKRQHFPIPSPRPRQSYLCGAVVSVPEAD